MPGSVFPVGDLPFIQYCELRVPDWTGSAAAIGLSTQAANEFKGLTDSARQAYTASEAARQDAKNATRTLRAAIKALRAAGGADVKTIRLFAQTQPDPNVVYNIAGIPSPSPRTPSVPPVAPAEITARLDIETGAITVRWKVAQPKGIAGVVYRVERSTGTGQTWELAGLVGGKSFEDGDVPTASTILYRIIAQRGNLASNPSQTLVINFGNGPEMTKQVFSTRNMKMAA